MRKQYYKPRTLVFLPPEETHSLEFHASGLRCFTIEIAQVWMDRTRDYSLVLDKSVHAQGGILANILCGLLRLARTRDLKKINIKRFKLVIESWRN